MYLLHFRIISNLHSIYIPFTFQIKLYHISNTQNQVHFSGGLQTVYMSFVHIDEKKIDRKKFVHYYIL